MRHFSNFPRPSDPVNLLVWLICESCESTGSGSCAAEAVLVLATRVATLGERTGRADLELENDKDEGAGALVLVHTIGTARLVPHDWYRTIGNCRTTAGQLRGNSWHC